MNPIMGLAKYLAANDFIDEAALMRRWPFSVDVACLNYDRKNTYRGRRSE